ncbi:MAG TPA: hypothetical protein VI636_01500 [Candidatus Angelobacter sp.]
MNLRCVLRNIPVVLLLTVFSPGQSGVPRQIAPGYNTVQEDVLRADLTFIASDALQGRLSLQTGDEVAIQWIASEFAKAKLKPELNGSYLQPVPLIEYRGNREQSFVGLTRTGNEKQLENDLTVRVVTAPLFLGTKFEAFNGRGKNDYFASHDLEDVIAVIDGRSSLLDKIRHAPKELTAYIAAATHKLIGKSEFLDALPGYLLPDPASQARIGPLLKTLEELRDYRRTHKEEEHSNCTYPKCKAAALAAAF